MPSTSSTTSCPEGRASATSATTLVLSRENLHDEDRVRRELTGAFGDEAVLVDGLGVVGAGITAHYVNLRRGTSCLKDHGIEPQGLATSSFRITWLVPRASLSDAVRELHTAFIVE
jgi:aspartate kinase